MLSRRFARSTLVLLAGVALTLIPISVHSQGYDLDGLSDEEFVGALEAEEVRDFQRMGVDLDTPYPITYAGRSSGRRSVPSSSPSPSGSSRWLSTGTKRTPGVVAQEIEPRCGGVFHTPSALAASSNCSSRTYTT
jgi:hypothetical protein